MAAPNFIQLARQAAIRARINPDAFVKQITAESGFNPRARSPAGAQGIAQIMPSTARGWGVNPNDPVAALKAAAAHMAAYERQTGSLKGALEMYNLGHTASDSQLPAETRNYIAKITGGGGGAPIQAVQGGSPSAAAPGGMNPRTQLALGLLGFGGAGAAAGGDPLAVALQQASQASPTRTAAAPAGSPSSFPAGGGGAGGGIYTQANLGRVDQGVDFRGSGAVPAVGDGVVTRVVGHGGPSGWPGGGFIVYKLTSGPQAGRYVYAAENIVPTVRVGQRVRAGQAIAKALGTSPYTEQGWATNAQGTTLARATSGYSEGQQTPAGKSFRAFLGKLR